jgi:membrane protein YqaA with SNARE-associated domain
MPDRMDYIGELMDFLEANSADPVTYGIVLFIYTIAATVFLPIPVEVALVLNPGTSVIYKALILGFGKAVGSIIVYYIGAGVGSGIQKYSESWGWFRVLVKWSNWMVERFQYVGLYVLLSIPGMLDTIPVYLFSVFNKEGVLELKYFALVNFLAGITRALAIIFLLEEFGIKLV